MRTRGIACYILLLLVYSASARGTAHHARARGYWNVWGRYRWQHTRRLTEQQQPQNITSKCLEGCSGHGVCNEELGECSCPRYRLGANCEQEAPGVMMRSTCMKFGFSTLALCLSGPISSCLNGCNGRGKCNGGFCLCEPGFYGADCSLSLDAEGKPELLAGFNYTVRSSGPKIYVYELPAKFNMYKSVFRVDRPLYLLFLQRLIGAGVRTVNPDEADYFYIPVQLRVYSDGEGLISAISYIRSKWPYWDRLHGHKHLIILAGDMGRAEMSDVARDIAQNVTHLTHWGLYADQPQGGWPKAHRPGQDIVIPIFIQPGLVDSYGMHATPMHPVHAKPRNSSLQFFFAGRICGNRQQPLVGTYPNCDLDNYMAGKGYSAGTRQKVFYYHGNRTGYTVVSHTKDYAKGMATARFCLAPTGGGHGKRNTLVTLLGCLPVTITDFVFQPFEPELNWRTFSVPVAEANISQLHEILSAITPEGYDKMHESLKCGAQHLFWSSIYGSIMGEDGRFDAFETLLAILRSRVVHPNVPPEQLTQVDPVLAAFMTCQNPEGIEPPPRKLCTHTLADNGVEQCKAGITKSPLLIPGGALCKGADNLAQCHRLYP